MNKRILIFTLVGLATPIASDASPTPNLSIPNGTAWTISIDPVQASKSKADDESTPGNDPNPKRIKRIDCAYAGKLRKDTFHFANGKTIERYGYAGMGVFLDENQEVQIEPLARPSVGPFLGMNTFSELAWVPKQANYLGIEDWQGIPCHVFEAVRLQVDPAPSADPSDDPNGYDEETSFAVIPGTKAFFAVETGRPVALVLPWEVWSYEFSPNQVTIRLPDPHRELLRELDEQFRLRQGRYGSRTQQTSQ